MGYQKKIRNLVLDLLAENPMKLSEVISILEEDYKLNNCAGCFSVVKPIQSAILHMLNKREIELTPDRYLRVTNEG